MLLLEFTENQLENNINLKKLRNAYALNYKLIFN